MRLARSLASLGKLADRRIVQHGILLVSRDVPPLCPEVRRLTKSLGCSTRFITDEIDYLYGLVFAGCCAALVALVFFFVIESKDRTLEEIDTMYVRRVNAIKSSDWETSDYRREDRATSETGSGSEEAGGH